MSVLMDYCLYNPDRDGCNLVARYLEKSPPPADSVEMSVLRAMTGAYYSLFQITDVERGVGISVQDLLRNETGFVVDIGFGNTAQRHLILASRIIPIEGFLTTGGAALPVNPAAARRILDELRRMDQTPETFDFKRISPLQGGGACRTRDPNLSLFGDVIKCRLCRTRWSNPLTDREIGSCTPRKKRSLPVW